MIELPCAKFQSPPECEKTIIKLSKKQLCEIGKLFKKRKRRRKGIGFNNRRINKIIDNLFKNNSVLPPITVKSRTKANCKIKNRKYHANFRKY